VPATDDPAEQQRVYALVGHPEEKLAALKDKIQAGARSFRDVEADFLDLMWTMDAYRMAEVIPRGMGNPRTTNLRTKLDSVYRRKGDWFSATVTLLLNNLTTSRLASRSRVQGFSQTHQIDIAWPDRDAKPLRDPLVCCEAKLTGAPSYGDSSGRGATDDWSNRRKELKFQATDLKLYRHVRANKAEIRHWDTWRGQAPPRVYSLWAARVESAKDVEYMVREARDLTDSYTDGVGVYAFQLSADGTRYEPAPVSRGVSHRVTSLDYVLQKIAAEIQDIIDSNAGKVPAPITTTDE
jgi:hypothetical protein